MTKRTFVILAQNQRGLATMIALAMVGLLTLLGIAALSTSDTEVSIAGNTLHEMRAFYAAEAGLEEASAMIQEQYESTGLPPSVMPEATGYVNSCMVEYSTIDNGAAEAKVLTEGALTGLHALVKTYLITSEGSNNADRTKVALTQKFEAALVPLFQFAVFYDDDLEIAPGQQMTINGRIHTNGNFYVQAAVGLNIDSYVTAAGDVIHGTKAGHATGNADVFIKDSKGLYQNMYKSGVWLDATTSNWYADASDRWGGRVRDEAFGQDKLKLPLTDPSNPRRIIQRGAGNSDSYEHKATLKFIDGKAYQKNGGVWTDVTAAMTGAGIISQVNDKFYDDRENKNVDVLDLDMGKLSTSTYFPQNGVVYFSDAVSSSSDWPALRLKNASSIGAAITIASENPVYTVGHYNSVNKKPSSILCDAFTILSSNWNDSKGAADKDERPATPTTVNTSLVSGDVNTASSSYSGGLENLLRFLESWGSANQSTFKGSIVNLWASGQATGLWDGDYYDPPARDWSYDYDLNDPSKQPPEVPKILVFTRVAWEQQFVSY